MDEEFKYLRSNYNYKREENIPYAIKDSYIEEEDDLSCRRRYDWLNCLARADLAYNFYFLPITKFSNREKYNLNSPSFYVDNFWINGQKVFYLPTQNGIALSLKPGRYNFKVEYVISNLFEVKKNRYGYNSSFSHNIYSYSSNVNERKTLELKDVYINSTREYVLCLSIKAIASFDCLKSEEWKIKQLYEFDKWSKYIKFELVDIDSIFECTTETFNASIYAHHYPINRDYSSYDFKDERYDGGQGYNKADIFNKNYIVKKIDNNYGSYYYGPIVNGRADGLGMKYDRDGTYHWCRHKWSIKYGDSLGASTTNGYGVHYFPNGEHVFGYNKTYNDLIGECMYFYPNGDCELRFYNDEGKADGTGVYFYGAGHMSKVAFNDGIRQNPAEYGLDSTMYLYDDCITGKRKIEIDRIETNNYIYTGQLRNGVFDGAGRIVYNNGEVYCGYFFNGKFQGAGTYYFKSGIRFHGYWKDGKANGQCRVFYTNGTFEDRYYENNKYLKKYWFDSTTIAPTTKPTVTNTTKPVTNNTAKTTVTNTTKPVTNNTIEKNNLSSSVVNKPTPNKVTTNSNLFKEKVVNTKVEPKTDNIKTESTTNVNKKPVNERYTDRESLPNGDFYTGMFLNGKYDGQGKMYYNDGTIYEGEWKQGKRHGKAIFRNKDVEYFECEFIDDKPTNYVKHKSFNGTYEGEWKDYKITGKGTFISNFNDKYVGEFKDGCITGKGIYTYHDGSKYEGSLVNNVYEGYGTLISSYGSKYEGMWKDGKYHGKGTYIYSDGKTKYEGDFVNGKCEGYGKYYSETVILEGQFKDDCLNGKGKATYSDGTCVEGDFVENLCHGKGIKTFNNKDKYEGDFENGSPTGYGKFSFYNGNKYEGQVSNGYFNGKGTFYYVNGTKYEGEFKNGMWHGKGKFYFNSGEIEEQTFDNDNLVSKNFLKEIQPSNLYDFKEIKGLNIKDNFYAGELLNNKPNGFGILIYSNGNYYIGQFDKGNISGFGLYIDISLPKVYVGEFKNSSLNGLGLEVNPNNTASFANFKDGKIVDEVKFIDNMSYSFNQKSFDINMQLYKMNGRTYFGGVLNNYFHNVGVVCYHNGVKYIGQYEFGCYKGLGVLLYPDGSFYIGMFENDCCNGYGMLVNKETTKIGLWQKNLFIG